MANTFANLIVKKFLNNNNNNGDSGGGCGSTSSNNSSSSFSFSSTSSSSLSSSVSNSSGYKFQFKLVLIGNPGVGKTCLAKQFTTISATNTSDDKSHQEQQQQQQKQCSPTFPLSPGSTIGVDFLVKQKIVKGHLVNLQLWDTAGQERFRSITQTYYRSAHCLLLVYDITSQPTFDALRQWCREMDQCTSGNTTPPLRVLIGNKCDHTAEREIPEHIGNQFAEANGFDVFVETSAIKNENIQLLFDEVAEMLIERHFAKISNSTLSPSSSMNGYKSNINNGYQSGYYHHYPHHHNHNHQESFKLTNQLRDRFETVGSCCNGGGSNSNGGETTGGGGGGGGKQQKF